MLLVAFLLLGESGGAAGGTASFELLETPGTNEWADFSLSRDGKSMGCLLDGAVYWWTQARGFRFMDQGVAPQGGVGMAADGGSLIAAKAGGGGALPAIWYRDGSSIDLGFLRGNCEMDHQSDGGFDLNADGTVAVGQAASCSSDVAFTWTAQSGLIGLPVTGTADSRGAAVSADGRVIVGFCEHPDMGYRRPALWRDSTGPVLFLGADGSGEALNVSLNGRYVVGQADMGGLSPQAFLWKEGTQPVSLGNLTGRATDASLAKAVSDDGKVVGWSGDALWGDQEAFIWTRNGGMVSLAAYLAARDIEVPRGMVLTAALDISGDGETVVGICRDKEWKQGVWLARLGETPAAAPTAQVDPWQPKPLDHVRPDTLDTYPADMLNPFPFGKRRF